MSMYGKPRFENLACGASMTKQSFADEVDINKILARFDKTGMISHLNQGQPFYGDVSEIADYQTALNVVHQAETLFGQMSAEIRERFGNDPALMIKFLDDPQNLQEAIDLGMVVKRPEVASGGDSGGKPAEGAPAAK